MTDLPPRSPNEELAELAARELLNAALLRPVDFERLQQGLSGGSLKAEDWITLAENALLSPSAPPTHPEKP